MYYKKEIKYLHKAKGQLVSFPIQIRSIYVFITDLMTSDLWPVLKLV